MVLRAASLSIIWGKSVSVPGLHVGTPAVVQAAVWPCISLNNVPIAVQHCWFCTVYKAADLSFAEAFNKPIYGPGRDHPVPAFVAGGGGREGTLQRAEEVKLPQRAVY